MHTYRKENLGVLAGKGKTLDTTSPGTSIMNVMMMKSASIGLRV
jgi:hypothetical protein